MWLIAGLGNPGREYEASRHNVGFMVLDNLADELDENFRKSPFNADICKTRIGTEGAILLKPTTYMNNSGQAVRAALDWYNLDERSLLVVYDDMDLPLGQIRLREKGSAGGHNGMKSIISHIGDGNFFRLRVGIGKPCDNTDVISHVLSPFSKEQMPVISKSVLISVDAVRSVIEDGFQKAQSKFNSVKVDEEPNL